jgi:AraC family transcriptional regulator
MEASMSWRGLIRSRATGAAGDSAVVHGWEVWRDGRLVRPVSISPTLSSDPRLWDGLALESYDLPPCDIPDHEHPTHYLSLQTSGPARAEWSTGGATRTGVTGPETIEVIPRGGRDRVVWLGQSSRLVVILQPRLLAQALEETAHLPDVELAQQMDLHDRHIASLMLALRADLEDGLPAGRLYGESLGTALAVYLQRRYAVRPARPAQARGGLPALRLRRVQEFIAGAPRPGPPSRRSR